MTIDEFVKIVFLFYALSNDLNEDMQHLFDVLYNDVKIKSVNIKNRDSLYVFCYVLIKSNDSKDFIKTVDANLVKTINRYSGEPSSLPIISDCINFLEIFEI